MKNLYVNVDLFKETLEIYKSVNKTEDLCNVYQSKYKSGDTSVDKPKAPIHQEARLMAPFPKVNMKRDYSKYRKELRSVSIVFAIVAFILYLMNLFNDAMAIWLSFVIMGYIFYLMFLGARIVKYFVIDFPNQKKFAEKELEKTPEYQAVYQKAVDDQHRRQLEFDDQYNKAVAKYNKDLSVWKEYQADYTERYKKLYEDELVVCNKKKSNLLQHLADLGIPRGYRDYDAFRFIYEYVTTSESTIQMACEAYDRKRQLQVDQQRAYEMRRANDIESERVSELNYQSQLQEEANATAEQHRKDMNRWQAARMYQEHHHNKKIEKAINARK